MTNTNDRAITGEARLKARRNRLWAFSGMGFLIAIIVGLATGFAGDLYEDGSLPAWSIYAIWALVVAAFTWFTISYFRRVDELDLMDNMWATLIAFYFYVVAMPSWYMFDIIGLAGTPQDKVIYLATLAVMFIAYGARKLGLR
ncbi:MAG: hypothetical protein P1U62_02225 [Alteraurantiacibacter sp. bin_em_oilr2.035]|nr:hypothetical protein [Alteraurantiacibacter sp. bin_em_oilr2.035]